MKYEDSAYGYYWKKDKKKSFVRGFIVGIVVACVAWFTIAGFVSVLKGTKDCLTTYKDFNC